MTKPKEALPQSKETVSQSKKPKVKHLQARGGEAYRFKLDPLALDHLKTIRKACRQTLALEPSNSVILRAAFETLNETLHEAEDDEDTIRVCRHITKSAVYRDNLRIDQGAPPQEAKPPQGARPRKIIIRL